MRLRRTALTAAKVRDSGAAAGEHAVLMWRKLSYSICAGAGRGDSPAGVGSMSNLGPGVARWGHFLIYVECGGHFAERSATKDRTAGGVSV
jgi:hypothetical protein